ncbi:thioredoxin family protein [Exiguobacterium sp. N5]|uniref:thioredoxin family protein n=1 Tax=Exiguobacterium sp. N5 TaxID=2990450 RepID=UPI0021F49173|nr:thioredoxin family protein [Exiguobacterium sp. N5]MCV9899778.1 thioredoxin family protein [Exiguobacterium sp. N5]
MKKWILISVLIISVFVIGFFVINTESMEKPLYEQTTLKDYKTMITAKETFFVYVYKTSCPACQQMKPTINEVIENNKVDWRAVNVEYEQNFDLSFLKEHKIDKTPTIIFYKNGIEQHRLEGLQSKKEIINSLKSSGYL